MFGGIHLDLGEGEEMLLNRKTISKIWKRETADGKVTTSIYDLRSEFVIALDGDLARVVWQNEVNRCRSTFTNKPEYWQEDITQLDRNQLLLLVGAIQIIETSIDADYQDEDLFSEQILEKIPAQLLNHITRLDSPGRYQFLASVAFALHTASQMSADLDSELSLVEPNPGELLEANN
jgi:hypothetical protein